jgi:hypothetical protein
MAIQYQPLPEFQAPNVNFMGAYAQGQALATNRLRQQMMEEQLARENALRGVLGQQGFDINSPQSVNQLLPYDLDAALKLKNAQEMAAYHKMATSNVQSEMASRQAKLPYEISSLKGLAKEHVANADAAQLKLFNEGTTRGQDILSRVSPDNWDQSIAEIAKLDPSMAASAPVEYDQKWVNKSLRTAKMLQSVGEEEMKRRLPSIQTLNNEVIEVQPGAAGAPPVVRPALVTPPEDMVSAPTVYAPGKEPAIGRLVTEGLPGERKPVTQREYKELPGRQQSSQIFGELSGIFKQLAERKAMPSVSMTPSESLRAVSAGSRAGQEVARVLDPESQRLRDEASTTIDQWIQAKRQSGSISAQEANTIDELERLKSMLGNPRMTIEAVQNILSRADRYSGLGKLKGYEPSEEEKKGVIDARKLTTGGGAAARPPLSSFFGK